MRPQFEFEMATMGNSGARKVIVVGGGISGLNAAKTLIKNGGFDVMLLEASDRVGGRIHSAKFGDHFVENGAQWVHGEKNNSVFNIASPLGLLDTHGSSLKFNADSMFVTEKGQVLSRDDHYNLALVFEKVVSGPTKNEAPGDQSLGIWGERVFWNVANSKKFHDESLLTSALDWIHRFQTGIDGSDNWFLPSCFGQSEYWECPGNPTIAWKAPACYSSLINLILHDSTAGFSEVSIPELPNWIKLNKEVVKANFEGSPEGNVVVECLDGTNYIADHVICTVSLGVLKANYKNLFIPALPQNKAAAIENLGFGCVNKLHFDFGSQWWPDSIIGFNLLWTDSKIVQEYHDPNVSDDVLLKEIGGFPMWCRGIMGFYVVASHPTALNSWMTGPSARLVEKLDDQEVMSVFMKLLKTFVGHLYEIPEPMHFTRSKWFQNPYTRGSYSFRSLNSEKFNVWSSDLAEPILNKDGIPTVCFAGEATHKCFYSTVHGAMDSGLREAQRLINVINGAGATISPLIPFTEEDFESEED